MKESILSLCHPKMARRVFVGVTLAAPLGATLTSAITQDQFRDPGTLKPGEFTWNGAYGTQFFCDPKERLVVVVGPAAPGELRK